MKQAVIHVMIIIGKFFLNLLYFFMKLRPVQHKVVFLSRQTNLVPLDFSLLEQELNKRENPPQIVMLCKMVDPGVKGKLHYAAHVLTAMWQLSVAQVAVVDTYCIPVSFLKQRKELAVFQIWHALGAVKKFGKQILGMEEGSSKNIAEWMGMHKHYTAVYCASEATASFYAEAFGVERDKIVVRGMPRVDYIQCQDKETKHAFFKDYPQFSAKPILLYLPTFRKGQHLDVMHLKKSIDHEQYQLIIKPHPLDDEPIEPQFLVDDRYTSYDLMKIADIIITDYSAISIEASLLLKPIYFYVYDILAYRDRRGLNIDLYEEMSSCISTKAHEIAEMIASKPYDYEALRRFRDRYVQTWQQDNTAMIVDDMMQHLK